MKIRILSSAIGLLILAAVVFAYFTPVFNIAVVIVLCIAMYEIYKCFGLKALPILLVEWLIAVILAFSNIKWVLDLTVPALFALMIIFAIYIIKKPDENNIHQLLGMLSYTMLIIFCFYPFVFFRTYFESLPNRSDAVYFMLLCMAMGWGADAFAYFVGRAYGKRKLSPKISPNKTIEGAIGGLFGSAFFVILLSIVYVNIISLLGFKTVITLDAPTIVILIILSTIGACLGVIGDLLASAVKRHCRIKDFGSMMPGHGGVLDRFDSVLFIAPMMVIYINYFIN